MNSSPLSKRDALRLLSESGCDERLMRHVRAVSKLAAEIAGKVKSAGHEVDVDFVETAAILHDIGRCRTHGIGHGLAGAEILADYPAYARVCRVHIGAGITKDEAEKAGLPPADYLPKTIEEKIITHADNLVRGEKEQTLDDAIKEFSDKLGADHPTIERIRKLGREVDALARK